ncbi:MAG: VOC family protein [Chloroflexi bacterium]|nr:VOC family protein [Chloroflexota bacterium]MCI0647471.1 VOC family protein [Chloroflexota bacterium]
MAIQGLHHITLVSADAQRTVGFYTGVLGLRLVKKTVNFDDPGSYHLYFGDEIGRPGTAVTFFEWPHAPRGRPGIGGTHHFALIVNDRDGLLKWKRRLTDLGLAVTGPYDRHYFHSIYFRDPDGVILEIATQGPGWTVDEAPEQLGTEHRPPPAELTINQRDEARIRAETWPEPVPAITPEMALSQGMHHISAISSNIRRTHDFLSGVLGLRRVKMSANFDDPASAHWYWGSGDGRPGTVITYFEHDPARARYHRAQMGAGQTHHFAFGVPDEETQLQFRDRLIRAGYRVSPVLDRVYFKSIYSNDPDGHIVELATAGPGFLVDEDRQSLGQGLMLPPWLEPHRPEIERALAPLVVKAPALEAA